MITESNSEFAKYISHKIFKKLFRVLFQKRYIETMIKCKIDDIKLYSCNNDMYVKFTCNNYLCMKNIKDSMNRSFNSAKIRWNYIKV
jgi:hypothetical protein